MPDGCEDAFDGVRCAYRALAAKGKKTTIVSTAIARELISFMWSIGQEVRPA
jgi:hypothetical protein